MDSVRYLSYHQWKETKGDTSKAQTYHQKLLTNVGTLETNVGLIEKLIKGYLDATKAFCGAGSQLAEAFSTVLKETPLLEISQQLKQVVEEIDHVAHKSSVHITSQILGTLCDFTATLPELRRAIEAHKRSVQNYESCTCKSCILQFQPPLFFCIFKIHILHIVFVVYNLIRLIKLKW